MLSKKNCENNTYGTGNGSDDKRLPGNAIRIHSSYIHSKESLIAKSALPATGRTVKKLNGRKKAEMYTKNSMLSA